MNPKLYSIAYLHVFFKNNPTSDHNWCGFPFFSQPRHACVELTDLMILMLLSPPFLLENPTFFVNYRCFFDVWSIICLMYFDF